MRWPTTPGSTTARGYGHTHQQARKAWATQVAQGTANCWRCGTLIPPGAPWDLGHDDHDRTITRGPEHPACNRAAAGHHAKPRKTRAPQPHPGLIQAPTPPPTAGAPPPTPHPA